jgi:hypothetical protein
MFKNRLTVSLLSGAALGVICILGGSLRLGWQGNQLLLFSLWYNRLLMGLVIGLASGLKVVRGQLNWLIRGALLGLAVSLAYFLTAGAGDWVSFLAGPVYGVITEYILKRLDL